jgi:hypothetical protein
MKAEINNQSKVKLFALYWGQKIIRDNTTDKFFPVDGANISFELEDAWLQLKPLSAISDEDAIKVGRLNPVMDNDLLVGKSICHWLDKRGTNRDITFEAVDYLRSKGYALPWMGLSVEEMVEAGWIKLIEQ